MKTVVCLAALALSSIAHAGETVFDIDAPWRYRLGTQEASSPEISVWRYTTHDDSAWAIGAAPLGYSLSDPATGLESQLNTILPSGSVSNYTCVFFRKSFTLTDAASITSLRLTLHIDDGAVAWLNAREVARINVGNLELPYNAVAINARETEVHTVSIPAGRFVEGANALAVQVFNASRDSSDLVFAATLEAIRDEAPTVALASPPFSAQVNSLALVEVFFNEAVTGVNGSDLLLNGVPATNVVSYAPNDYLFYFAEPAPGPVEVSFALNHGIADTDATPTPFAGTNWTYTLDTNVPVNVRISEFLADNSANIEDEDGDNVDWIEIYNAGPSTVDLGGWHLTDDPSWPDKWTFPSDPSVVLDANTYLLMWASGKNRTADITRLHTNFRLERSGEYLGLLTPNLEVVSEFSPAPQFTDRSYGRDRFSPNLVGYYMTPTPGQPNSMTGPGFTDPPVFSVPSSVFTENSITVALTAANNAEIRYTLDGSEPVETSSKYTSALVFSTNIVIKARAFDPALWPSLVVARTYQFLDPSVQTFTSKLPIVVVSTTGRQIPQNVPSGGNRQRGSLIVIDTFRGRSTMQTMPQFHGLAEFERYGQTAAGFVKYPIRVEVNDEMGNDLPVSLLGLPPEGDFQLEVKMSDKSFLNGFLAHELHQQMGHYAPRRRFVELFADVDGGKIRYPADYLGVYELAEKIERDPQRVDVAKLTPSHTTEPEISGGYIIKKDKDSIGDLNFTVAGGNGFASQMLKIHEPKPRFITPAQRSYLNNYLNAFSASLHAANWLQLTDTNHYSHYIDVDSFVDQHWIVEYTKNIDGYRLSRFWSKDRGGKLVDSPIWDFDLCFGNANYLQGGMTNGWYWNIQQEGMGSGEHAWHRRLVYGLPNIIGMGGANGSATSVMNSGDPVFIQKIIDRWGELRTNILANERVLARVDELAALLSEAATRNYTKFQVLSTPLWPNPDGTGNWHVNYATQPNYQSLINEVKKWITGRFHWLDAQFVRAPLLNHPGGFITAPVELAISAPAATIYYTTNGSDPRAQNGAVSANAQVYSGTIPIQGNAAVFARARVGTNQYSWSPPAVANFYTQTPPLRITEIMYHDDWGFEYVEVQNIGERLNLAGFRLSGGIEFTFPALELGPGERALVVEDLAAFQNHYGLNRLIAGEYSGSLDNAGGRLILTGPLREPILDFAYDDAWYPITDGLGFSLVIVDAQAPTTTWGDPASWRPSGAQNLPQVVINEVLSNPQNGAMDMIELHNPGNQSADISGWYLTDDLDRLNYRIPNGTVIAAGGYLVLTEDNFNFGLAQEGEEIFLLSANEDGSLSGYLTGFQFGGQRTGVSFGRHVTSVGEEHFVSQRQQTFGAANAGPAIPDVVISEIMYRPQEVFANGAYWDNTEDEFIELHNRSGAGVDLSGHVLEGAGIYYQFGSALIESGGYLLVVSFDPAANPAQLASFRAKFDVPLAAQIVGPYAGSLANEGGALGKELSRTDGVDSYVDWSGAHYEKNPRWSSEADGTGLSLNRVALNEYGDDPVNWSAGVPSPGKAFTPGPAPVITAHPQDLTVIASETATASFSVSVSDSDVRYQWRKNNQNITGATSDTFTLTGVGLSDAGNYHVMVWTDTGFATSSNAVLTVRVGIRIHEQPRDVSVRIPGSARFEVLASSSSTIAYQWRFNGIFIPGENGPELLLNNITEADEGLYDVLMTDSVGSVLSAAARLTVTAPPEMTAPVPPLSLAAAAGETITVSARLSGTLPIYARWRWSRAEGGTLTLGEQIVNERVTSFSFVVPTGTVGRVRVSLTNVVGGTLGSAGTPTNAVVTVLADTDGDRIPDAYERQHGMNENDPVDATADPDNDTMTNRDEYIAGTDPQDSTSYLKVERLETANSATIYFPAISNRTYAVQYSDALNPAAWQKLQDLVARPTNYSATVFDPASTLHRFYRLAIPTPRP